MARKHKHPEHVNHERWLVSYADFITLLFATFTALYALSRSDVDRAKQVAESMRYYFGASDGKMIPQEAINTRAIPADKPKPVPGDTTETAGPSKEANREDFEEIKHKVEEYLITKGMLGKVQVDVEERGLLISLKEAGFFESGNAEVKPEAYAVLEEVAAQLKKYKNPVRVEGHTDNVPMRSRTYPSNWELSSTRATNVARLLSDRYKIPPSKISATGYAEFRPKSDNNSPAGRARNRRVDLVVLSTEAQKAEPGADQGP